ncbi:mucin-2, partial [Centroberyx affinis]|uniref:mucin-2 n=1 Tax=Centroberyx affinis TaxID=166261 RepID=UPI003A5C2649
MALSQIQCLDDNHVNPRTHESKPEFLYCEDQRLALEALLRDGREAFGKFLEARGLRGFLSDLELESFAGAVEPYDPGSEELYPADAEDDEPPLSLHYWPELSDTSVAQMDLGWPDSVSYRGVTRTNVYAQPPLDGQTHIKEIVRKTIAQAQKVIAVVMDMFTDVDIFRDLLDAGFKRKVSVYILLERTALPHFLSMCQRANMHAGHLKNLRVRCAGGEYFYTRSCTRVRGRLGYRFMFVDGDKAVSGSYSFTWMSSRLDRHLITVVTGQAVDAFDRLFRDLYMTSSAVDLRQIAKEAEPEPEYLTQTAPVAPPSADVARKLYNPKYALLALGNNSPTSSSGNNSPKDSNTQNPALPESRKGRRRRANKGAVAEAPPLHPGLVDLEKAYLIPYLPTWPEPDPPSDVIGFINIRDASRPTQVHLQRSERFETSQAIRFSSPISVTEAALPEVAKPRQLTAKYEEKNVKPTQANTKSEESVAARAQPTQLSTGPSEAKLNAQAPEQKVHTSGPNTHTAELKHTTTHPSKSEPKTEPLSTERNLPTNTPTNHNTSHNTSSHLNTHTSQPSNNNIPTLNAVNTNTPKPQPLPVLKRVGQTEPSLNTHNADIHSTHTHDSNNAQTSHPASVNTDATPMISQLKTEQHAQTQNLVPHADLRTQAVRTQPQNPPEKAAAPSIPTPTVHNLVSSSSASPIHPCSVSSTSENTPVPVTSVPSTISPPIPSAPLVPSPSVDSTPTSASSLPPVTSSSTTPDRPVTTVPAPPIPSPSASTPPVPKPRTVQLVIKGSGGLDPPEVSVVTRPGNLAGAGPLVGHSVPDVATVTQTQPGPQAKEETESVPEMRNKSGTKTGVQTDIEKNSRKPREGSLATQQTQSGTSQDVEGICEEAVGLQNDFKNRTKEKKASTKLQAQSDVLIANTPQTGNSKEMMPREVETKTVTLTDHKIVPKPQPHRPIETEATARPLTDCQSSKAPIEDIENATQSTYIVTSEEHQQIAYYVLKPQKRGSLASVGSLSPEPATHNPVSATHTQKHNPISGTPIPKHSVDGTAPSTFQESQQSPKVKRISHMPEKFLRLHLSDSAAHAPELRSPTPERVPLHTPTPDSRTHTPDPRCHTPDFRTPTSDVSDGYISPREDSTLSTTSEEYYECSDSPLCEPVFERLDYHSHWATEDQISFTHANTATPTTANSTPTPAHVNTSVSATTYGTKDRSTSGSDTHSLSGSSTTTRISSSSLIEKEALMRKEGETANEENGRGEGEEERKMSVLEKRNQTERASPLSQGTERGGSRSSLEAKRTANHFTEGRGVSEAPLTAGKDEEAQAPKRKRAVDFTPAEDPVAGGAKPGESTNEGAETEELSACEYKAKELSSEGGRPEEVSSGVERAADAAALGPSGAERRDRTPSATREAEGKK